MLITSLILAVIITLTVIAYFITSHPLVELKSQELEQLNPQSIDHHQARANSSHHPIDHAINDNTSSTNQSQATDHPAPAQEFFKSENTQILAAVPETPAHQADSDHQAPRNS